MSGSRALLVFAKTPKPGKVKTRLLAAVSAEVAAALHEGCIADTLRLVRKMRGCDVIVFEGGGTGYFRELVKKQKRGVRVRVLPQRGADLGARMENAFRKCFAMGYREVVVIGTDTPWMGAERVRRAGAESVCGVEGERCGDWAGGRWRILFAGHAEVCAGDFPGNSVEYGAGFGVDVESDCEREAAWKIVAVGF